jgi:hypothetical protein
VARRGEASLADLDRDYPHQILLRADHHRGSAYRTVQGFCVGLSLAPHGHAIFKDDAWHHVFCFSDPVDAETFRARFGGEVFDPAARAAGEGGGTGAQFQVNRDNPETEGSACDV